MVYVQRLYTVYIGAGVRSTVAVLGLLSLPDLESEGAGSPAEDGVGDVVEREKGGDNTAAPDPDEAGAEEISRELAGQLATQIVPGKRKSRSIQRLFFFNFEIVSTGISSPFKNSFGKTNGAPAAQRAPELPADLLSARLVCAFSYHLFQSGYVGGSWQLAAQAPAQAQAPEWLPKTAQAAWDTGQEVA